MPSIYENSIEAENKPTYVVDLSNYGQISAVHLSPFQWSQNVILIAFDFKIVVGHITLDVSIIYMWLLFNRE